MIVSKRVQSLQRSPSHISYPVNSELAPSFSSPDLLVSPPTTPPRTHKHTLSKPMSWLNRSSASTSSHSAPHAAQKPTRVSEPRIGSSLDQIGTFQRSGPLGSGATIVRTPQEALFGPPTMSEQVNEKQGSERGILLDSHAEENESLLPPLSHSPPLPPLPDISDATGEDEGEGSISTSPTSIPLSDHASRPRSPATPSPKTQRSSPPPTAQAHSRAPSRSIPTLPTEADTVSPQPSFEAVLLSSVPDGPLNPSKLIIALETCTTTYRTSLRTLVSRPSHLSRYVTSLLLPASETASVYSNSSDTSLAHHTDGFNSVFRDHLASSGFLSQSSYVVHVFLDRPSAPYAHVLAYLRSLPSVPETLPRAVQLGSQSPSRLESLLELCDEASYLGLEALYNLCRQEINRVHRAPFPTCLGGGLHRGKTGSVRSFRTVVEQCQSQQDARPPEPRTSTGKSATRESSVGSSCENKDLLTVRESSRERKGFRHEVGSPPPGWI